MTINLPILPYDCAVGAEIDITFDTIEKTSEGGNSATGSRRPLAKRVFHLTIGPAEVPEFVKIALSALGKRFPVGVRDWYNFEAVDVPLQWHLQSGDTFAQLAVPYVPATGSRSYLQPILCPDQAEVPLVIKVDGFTTSFSLIDPGLIRLSSELSGGQVMTWSGRYVFPARFVDDSLTIKIYERHGINGIPDIQLQEILAPELMRLAAE